MPKFYTFKQWIAAHPETRQRIRDCEHCDWEGTMDCPCNSTAGCKQCNHTGEIECPFCMRDLRREYKALMKEEKKQFQRWSGRPINITTQSQQEVQ